MTMDFRPDRLTVAYDDADDGHIRTLRRLKQRLQPQRIDLQIDGWPALIDQPLNRRGAIAALSHDVDIVAALVGQLAAILVPGVAHVLGLAGVTQIAGQFLLRFQLSSAVVVPIMIFDTGDRAG